MKISKFNENKKDILFIRGAISEFNSDVKEIFDNYFVEFLDVYFNSNINSSHSTSDLETTYSIYKNINISKGFTSVIKAYGEAYEAYQEFEVVYQHVLDTFNSGSLFDDYPMPKTIGYNLIKGLDNNGLKVGIQIHINYSE